MRHRCRNCADGSAPAPLADSKPLPVGVVNAKISALSLPGETEARYLLRRALREAEPAAQRFSWHLSSVCELPVDDDDVGYTAKDGTIYVKVRNPSTTGSRTAPFYSYSFVLATFLHELVHLTHLGHGKAFYRCLSAALSACGAEAYVKREARTHVCAELLNAVCDNDARRARALLEVMPEAAMCRRPGAESSQLPLEYAAHHGRVALTKLLLEARADPALCSGSSTGKGVAPLARAAANGNAKTAALLLAARANVVEVSEPKGQSVLDKAIAAAEAASAIGKGREWWKVAKVLSDDNRPQNSAALASNADLRAGRRARSASRGRRRRRKSQTESTTRSAEDAQNATPRSAPARALSMPALSSVPSLPALSGAEARRPLAFSRLAGSLAL